MIIRDYNYLYCLPSEALGVWWFVLFLCCNTSVFKFCLCCSTSVFYLKDLMIAGHMMIVSIVQLNVSWLYIVFSLSLLSDDPFYLFITIVFFMMTSLMLSSSFSRLEICSLNLLTSLFPKTYVLQRVYAVFLVICEMCIEVHRNI